MHQPSHEGQVTGPSEDSKRYWYIKEQWYTATVMKHSIMRGLAISQVSWGQLVQAWKSGEHSLSLTVMNCQETDSQPIPAAYTVADCYMYRANMPHELCCSVSAKAGTSPLVNCEHCGSYPQERQPAMLMEPA